MHIGFLFNKAKDSANMPNCLHNSQIRKYHANPLILQTQVPINSFTFYRANNKVHGTIGKSGNHQFMPK